jgi:addiction module HigA family antidote
MNTPEKSAMLETTPGRILFEEFLEPLNLSQSELSRRTGIPRSTINEIIKHKRPINADVAVALGLCFETSPHFWMNLQSNHDIMLANTNIDALRRRIIPSKITIARRKRTLKPA